MKRVIAERKLNYSLKNEDRMYELAILVFEPALIENEQQQTVAVCSVQYDGIDFEYPEIYGMDRLQALDLALRTIDSNMDVLKEKYDFYFLDGTSYFEDDSKFL